MRISLFHWLEIDFYSLMDWAFMCLLIWNESWNFVKKNISSKRIFFADIPHKKALFEFNGKHPTTKSLNLFLDYLLVDFFMVFKIHREVFFKQNWINTKKTAYKKPETKTAYKPEKIKLSTAVGLCWRHLCWTLLWTCPTKVQSGQKKS